MTTNLDSIILDIRNMVRKIVSIIILEPIGLFLILFSWFNFLLPLYFFIGVVLGVIIVWWIFAAVLGQSKDQQKKNEKMNKKYRWIFLLLIPVIGPMIGHMLSGSIDASNVGFGAILCAFLGILISGCGLLPLVDSRKK